MRVAVIGSAGQLGSDIVRCFSAAGAYEVQPLTHDAVDVADAGSVRDALAARRPEVVINCAAFHQVDLCEDRPGEAFTVNAQGSLAVGRACAEIDALYVYVSTDYVFEGTKGSPYSEGDVPGPINVYGMSKLAGEHLARQSAPRWLVARVSSLFGRAGAGGRGGNFVETILGKAREGGPLKVVDDSRMSPTYSLDAAGALEALVSEGATGVFHLTNEGSCTWHEFAVEMVRMAGLAVAVEPVASSEYPRRARRPVDSSLETVAAGRVASERLRPWDEGLRAYLLEKGHIPG